MRGKKGVFTYPVSFRLTSDENIDPDEAEVFRILMDAKENYPGGIRALVVRCVLAQHNKAARQVPSVTSAYREMNRRMSTIEALLTDLQNGYVRVEGGQFVSVEPEQAAPGGRRLSTELQDNISQIISDVTFFEDDEE